ncbi:TerD family protein [Paenibacillus sp. Leaf72]|uniref:TerD family protein n=1 Tax=Paenibacillus sp. Leaf72 TaxID=1736234 RepID=UPI0006F8AE9B|nr:TerD family protein [Paenibacillus sp. Leaf72]KQN96975.1 hypothetical protein ASF12_23185 [Paenibacillus sp. Leaf72]
MNLDKGQAINLSKSYGPLPEVNVGLGWRPAANPGERFDLDASAFMLDVNGKIFRKKALFINKKFVVSFRVLESSSPCGSVRHSGDNVTGAGAGDDETIHVKLAKVPNEVEKILFVVNIFSPRTRRQDFSRISDAYIRIVNPTNGHELVRFNLTENYSGKTAMIVAELYRNNETWEFSSIGEGSTDQTLEDIECRYL